MGSGASLSLTTRIRKSDLEERAPEVVELFNFEEIANSDGTVSYQEVQAIISTKTDVFISYDCGEGLDQDSVDKIGKIIEFLKNNEIIASCSMFEDFGGTELTTKTTNDINNARSFLFCITQDYLSNDLCQAEFQYIMDNKPRGKVVPLLIQPWVDASSGNILLDELGPIDFTDDATLDETCDGLLNRVLGIIDTPIQQLVNRSLAPFTPKSRQELQIVDKEEATEHHHAVLHRLASSNSFKTHDILTTNKNRIIKAWLLEVALVPDSFADQYVIALDKANICSFETLIRNIKANENYLVSDLGFDELDSQQIVRILLHPRVGDNAMFVHNSKSHTLHFPDGEYTGEVKHLGDGQLIRHGKGKMFHTNGEIFTGTFHEDKKHGRGATKLKTRDTIYQDFNNGEVCSEVVTYVYENGDKYVGTMKNGEENGYGVLTYANGDVYEGFFKNDDKVEHGRFSYVNGDVYEGEFKNDEKCGKGKFIFKSSGNSYVGDFHHGSLHGHGIMTFANGDVFEGPFRYDERVDGLGRLSEANGDEYDGYWVHHKRHGPGSQVWHERKEAYVGDWVENEMHGLGKFKNANGDIYEGQFMNSLRNGRGIVRFADGDVFEGSFKDGRYHGNGVFNYAAGGSEYGEYKHGKEFHVRLGDSHKKYEDLFHEPPPYEPGEHVRWTEFRKYE